ncbi:MAG: hypothetical protein K9N06_02285 [Candidatus Cloacimonetes bacterium]|nr:hypothetical protein [Candidatus Cloacimonadota bacterium]
MKLRCYLILLISLFSAVLFAAENFLIVAPEALQNNASLIEFINWKTTKGFGINIDYIAESATLEEIDNWVEDQYDLLEPAPRFLLLIGDTAGDYVVPTQFNDFPTGPGNLCSDLVYGVMGEITPSNRIPEIYVGRFSISSEEDLQSLINKTLWYERDQYLAGADVSYLSSALGVSNNKPDFASYQNAIISYGWDYYFNDTYPSPYTGNTNGITGITYVYPHPDTLALVQNIKDQIDSGLGFYYYIGNSDAYRFKFPDFTIADLQELNNFQKYPIVMGGG